MGRDPEADGLQALRRDGGDRETPLNEQKRTVQKFGSSLYLNVTGYARDTHGIDKGDELSIATYPDGIRIGFDDE